MFSPCFILRVLKSQFLQSRIIIDSTSEEKVRMESPDAPKQVGAVLKDFPEYKEGAGRGVEDIGQVRIVPVLAPPGPSPTVPADR